MESLMHVGNKVDKDTATNLKEVIKTIFEVGHKNHVDQETMRDALEMVGRVSEVKNITVRDSTFTGTKVVAQGGKND